MQVAIWVAQNPHVNTYYFTSISSYAADYGIWWHPLWPADKRGKSLSLVHGWIAMGDECVLKINDSVITALFMMASKESDEGWLWRATVAKTAFGSASQPYFSLHLLLPPSSPFPRCWSKGYFLTNILLTYTISEAASYHNCAPLLRNSQFVRLLCISQIFTFCYLCGRNFLLVCLSSFNFAYRVFFKTNNVGFFCNQIC